MRHVVILSTADYDSAVWTNKQHIAQRLAQSHDIVYINSMGLRSPGLNKADIRRVLSRLRVRRKQKMASPHPTAESHMRVVRPLVLPYHAFRAIRAVNRLLVLFTIRRRLRDFRPFVLWTFSPVTYGLENDADGTVYHCVDLLHDFPGVPSKVFLQAERKLTSGATRAIASSSVIAGHLRASGFGDVSLWENVADIELFGKRRSQRENIVIYAGSLTEAKCDIALMLTIVDSGLPLRIAGPVALDGTSMGGDLQRLIEHPNVHMLGILSQSALAAELSKAVVGLIPYNINRYTDGVFPMKVYEYLASGLTVVSTKLPSLLGRQIPGLDTVDRSNFLEAVERAVRDYDADSANARVLGLASNSWTHRLQQVRELVDQILDVSATPAQVDNSHNLSQ